ncbi:Trp repressor binding protein (plasmid) [Fischerella sp. NIES-4106]|nr:Trp repressor binding protein [Fischerella sp. NIES-4106]
MANVLIVYSTDYGNTRKMAEAIASGAMSVLGTQVSTKLAEEATTDDLIACDALIIGTPVHMGSPDWRIKKFIDTVCGRVWMKDSMIGKVGAIFTTGGGYGNAGGGCELTMLALLNNLAQMGMVIVPLPKNTPGYHLAGLQWGPYGRSAGEMMEQTGVTEERLEVARYHGANVSRIASALKGQDLFAKPIPVSV